MKGMISFAIYLLGVVFISWNQQLLRDAMDFPSFMVLLVFYLYGVSQLGSRLGQWIETRWTKESEE